MTYVHARRTVASGAAVTVAIAIGWSLFGPGAASGSRAIAPQGSVEDAIDRLEDLAGPPDGDEVGEGSESDLDPGTIDVLADAVVDDQLIVVAEAQSFDGVDLAATMVFDQDPATGQWRPRETTHREGSDVGWADVYELSDGTEVVAYGNVSRNGVDEDRTAAPAGRADDVAEHVPSGSGIVVLDELAEEDAR